MTTISSSHKLKPTELLQENDEKLVQLKKEVQRLKKEGELKQQHSFFGSFLDHRYECRVGTFSDFFVYHRMLLAKR